ncbi:MAG: DUF5667 domain-containing protein [Propionibacteriales bacterium]|nr:DUF5667 domain-containing protein [Propionibacteriales bacterium]
MIRRPGRDDAQAFHEAWESGAHGTGQVAELVRTAQTLRTSASAAPRPEFTSALRERLIAEGRTVLVPAPGASRRTAAAGDAAPAAAPSRARRRLATAAVAAVSSLGVVGLVASSASALPGDVLYPVKRTVEDVELALHRSDEARGTQRLELAAERLREVRAVIADGSPAARHQVPDLLDEFSTQAEQGSASLFDAYDTDGSTASIETVNDFAAASAVDLTTMAADVPADATESFSAARRRGDRPRRAGRPALRQLRQRRPRLARRRGPLGARTGRLRRRVDACGLGRPLHRRPLALQRGHVDGAVRDHPVHHASARAGAHAARTDAHPDHAEQGPGHRHRPAAGRPPGRRRPGGPRARPARRSARTQEVVRREPTAPSPTAAHRCRDDARPHRAAQKNALPRSTSSW